MIRTRIRIRKCARIRQGKGWNKDKNYRTRTNIRKAQRLGRDYNKDEDYNLKGQCHEIFDLYIFSLIEPIWAPDKQAEMVFLKDSFSRRYSNFFDKLDL